MVIPFMNSECLVFWSETKERVCFCPFPIEHHDDAPSASVRGDFVSFCSLNLSLFPPTPPVIR